MIRVDRQRVEAPSVLGRPAARALAELRELFEKGEGYRSQHRYEFDSGIWAATEVRQTLNKLFHRKCAFCGRRPATGEALEVAHFRPREKTTGIKKGSVAPDHYWWLAYEWSNLYPICRDCHRYKSSSFPIDRRRAEPGTTATRLRAERPLLLDPCADDPEAELEYNRSGRVCGGTLRAKVTIEALGLNRPGLVARRKTVYADLDHRIELWRGRLNKHQRGGEEWRRQVEWIFGQLRSKVVDSAEFAGLKRQRIRRALANLKLGPVDAPAGLEIPAALFAGRRSRAGVGRRERNRHRRILKQLSSTWITSIDLKNFKGIHELRVEFPPAQCGRDPWVMLLGTNGVGKSSVLKAIALALITDEDKREKLVPDASAYMNHCASERDGHVFIHLNTGKSVELHFSRYGKKFRQSGAIERLKVLGFGSTRLPPPLRGTAQGTPKRRIQWVDNLFDPHRPLCDPERWLADPGCLPTRWFNPLKPALKDLLGLGPEVGLSRLKGSLYVHQYGGRSSLREASDGYQTVVTLATEIIRNLSESGHSADDVEGTVLLDEIEAHLHPVWKVRIIATLRKIFPHVRFIVTTHDPLCLRGLEEDEICLLRRDAEGSIEAHPRSVPPGLRTDQLLTGEWFGLGTTLDEDTFELMQQHWRLLLKRGKTDAERRRQHTLEKSIHERTGAYMETDLSRMGWSAAARHMPDEPHLLSYEERREVSRKLRDFMSAKRKSA